MLDNQKVVMYNEDMSYDFARRTNNLNITKGKDIHEQEEKAWI